MKALRNPYTWSVFVILALVALVTGCNTPNRPQGTVSADYNQEGTATVNAGMDVTTNVNVGITGQYNVPTGNWSAGFTITFKDVVPPYEAEQLVKLGGVASRSTANTWTFPNVKSPSDPAYMRAVALAGGVGGFTLTPVK